MGPTTEHGWIWSGLACCDTPGSDQVLEPKPNDNLYRVRFWSGVERRKLPWWSSSFIASRAGPGCQSMNSHATGGKCTVQLRAGRCWTAQPVPSGSLKKTDDPQGKCRTSLAL